MTSSASTQNRTTVRSMFSGLQALSPSLAAQLAAAAMFRTQRRPSDAWERERTASAEQFTVPGPHGKIAVQRWGKGPLVILVHGWNGRGSQLAAFVEPLVRSGFQVIAFDAPGHGKSAGSTSSLVDFADGFDAVVDAVRPFFQPVQGVVAHSLGGAAVTFALSRGSTSPRSDAELGQPPRLVFIAPPIDLRDFVSTVSSELGLRDSARRALERAVERRVRQRLDDLRAIKLAPTMQSPLLIIHDEQDRAVPIACGETLMDAWPGARLKRTRGLGHNRILRDPATIAAAVAHLNRTPSEASS